MLPPRSLVRDDRALSAERTVVWLLVLAVTAAVVGSAVLYGDELRRDVPDADFTIAFDEDTRTVTVEHAGGDPVRDRETQRLSVAIEDSDTGASASVSWVGDGAGISARGQDYPVTEGDALTVDDPTVDADGDGNYHDADASVGIHLDATDTARVIWRGTRRSGETGAVTLANASLG